MLQEILSISQDQALSALPKGVCVTSRVRNQGFLLLALYTETVISKGNCSQDKKWEPEILSSVSHI